MNVKKLAMRLGDLPWRWVCADLLFSSGEELIEFAVLSKDAPHTIALAVEENDGFNMVNIEISRLVAGEQYEPVIAGCGQRRGDLIAHPLSRVYVPLGFAQDVQAWRELASEDDVPNAYWVSEYLDMTRDVEEGGDRDRWFSAYFIDGSWWVVDWPGTMWEKEVLSDGRGIYYATTPTGKKLRIYDWLEPQGEYTRFDAYVFDGDQIMSKHHVDTFDEAERVIEQFVKGD